MTNIAQVDFSKAGLGQHLEGVVNPCPEGF